MLKKVLYACLIGGSCIVLSEIYKTKTHFKEVIKVDKIVCDTSPYGLERKRVITKDGCIFNYSSWMPINGIKLNSIIEVRGYGIDKNDYYLYKCITSYWPIQ